MECPYKPHCTKGILEPIICENYKKCELYLLLKEKGGKK